MTQDVSQAGIGTAYLSENGDDTYTIHGVALGAGDVTVGSSGIKKKWPAEELKEAAGSLEGKPLVRDHENSTEGAVGEVVEAYYRPGVGVMYEGEIASHYEELIQDIRSGLLEVSARAYHDPVDELEEDEDSGALVVENIRFDNLSIVTQGAAPSNTLQPGEATAMGQGPEGGAVATLEQGAPRPSQAELEASYSEGDWVTGESSGGTWHGKVRGMKTEGCYNEEIDGDFEVCADDDSPVYLIENYDVEDGEFTDTMVAHQESGMSSWDHEENHDAAQAEAMTAELEGHMEELDEVYSEWSDHVNMTASELEEWAQNPCSGEASVDPEAVIGRNMRLLETDKSDWTEDEIEDAKRTISFISRMSDESNEPEDPRDGPHGCPSEWAISLLNWAHNPFDSIPDVPDEMTEENMDAEINYDAVDGAVWFETPDHGDMVTTPVEFITDAKEFVLESNSNPAREGHGHLHLLVNQEFVEPGEKVPKGEGYYHLTDGKRKFEIELPPGEHTLRLQAGDARHHAYDMTDEIDVEVIEPDVEENMPRSEIGDPPEWEEGDMVTWQVEPDLFGEIVHVDEQKHVAMVEIMGMDGGEMTSTGFTITAGFSDIRPMRMPKSDSDMSYHDMDEEENSASESHRVSELAEINGMDVNGLVMWDDKMGSIGDFMMEDGELMLEIDVIEREDGAFQKTGETETVPLTEAESMARDDSGTTEELEVAWHTPDWDGTDDEREWERPTLSEFMDEYGWAEEYDSWDALPEDARSQVAAHFTVSQTGEWPPEDYGDLALPVVFPDGDLSLDGLDSAHQVALNTDGVSEDMGETLQDRFNEWAIEHFDQPVAGEEMSDETLDLEIAVLNDDDPDRASTGAEIAALQITTDDD